MFRKIFLAAIAVSAVLLPVSPVWADSKFSADYAVTYEIQTSGTTVITQNIDLRNLTANYYATQYSLSIGATRIRNVTATSSSGASIPVTLSTEADTTKITVSFNEKVVGLNRVLSFHLRYESDDIAVKNGFVWEVTIPRLATTENIGTYNLTLKTPKEIGTIASISPNPVSTLDSGNFNLFNYNKDLITKSGVNASFGDHQVFNFTLKYHLGNSRIFPIIETVALPPDTENQTVVYSKLDPAPQEITVDTDGNYLAKYRLEGNSKQEVTLTGQVKIWNKPTNPARFAWTEEQLRKYTTPDKYWESNFPAIMDKAKELKTAKAIYDYVSTTLKYDYARAAGTLERFGASVAIGKPNNAVCMEFTDLFIAMARAAGIPARELDGYAYTTNSKLKPRSFSVSGSDTKTDILHAWPEYWNADKKQWVQIDPTWGSTTGGVDYFNKLDMNHFVFVIKGLSSTDPFPAGSYKTDPKTQTGDVDVSIAPTELEVTAGASVKLSLSSEMTAGIPFSGQVLIENSGNSSIFGSKLTLNSQVIQFSETDLGPIPPLSKKSVGISGRAGGFSLSAEDTAVATLTGQDAKGQIVSVSAAQLIRVQPLLQALIPWILTLLGLIAASALFLRFWPRIRPAVAARFPWLLKEDV